MKKHRDSSLSDEMQEHLEQLIDELVASGQSREQATLAAQRRFGNRTSLLERSREVWGRPLLEHFLQDLRYAARTLLRSPFFAAAVVLPLALGMGANTAIFTVVEAALIRALPYRAPERLVHLFEFSPQNNAAESEASYPDFVDWSGAARYFGGVSAYSQAGIAINDQGSLEQIAAARVSANFFTVLGTEPALGRTFLSGEDRRGAERVVLLGDGIWRRRFGADPSVVGRTVFLNNQPFHIIGILPPQFQFAKVGRAEIWLPLIPSPAQEARRYWHWVNVIARLKTGATSEQARTELAAVGARIAQSDPQHHAGRGIRMAPLQDEIVGQVRPVLLVLMGTIGLVLLLACANVANLILARSASRQKEIAVRASMGAGRGRLVQQLLTESLLLALLGGSLGMALAFWGVRILTRAIPADMRSFMPYLDGLTLNWSTLGFTAAVTLLTAAGFGLAPALRISRSGLSDRLQSGQRTSSSGEHRRFRRLLLVSEVAISAVLLVGAGLMMKSTLRLLEVNPGFNPDRLVTMMLSMPGAAYTNNAQVAAFHQTLLDRLASLPGVAGAATVSVLPLSGGGDNGNLRLVDHPAPPGSEPVVNVRTVSTSYFHTMGLPMMAGRALSDRDNEAAPKVVWINQQLARTVFPKQDPLGQRIGFEWSPGPWQIAGVVADENTVSLDVETRPVVYFPYLQSPARFVNLVIRATAATEGIPGAVREEARRLDATVPVYGVRTMEQLIADAPSTFVRRYPAFLIGIFAGIALVLATVGIYGLVAYTVSQRTQEIGIRIALGAQPTDILKLVMGQGMILVLAGLAIGLVAASLFARALATMLFGVKPSDVPTFLLVSALLAAAALAASYLPARRAMKLPPSAALNGNS